MTLWLPLTARTKALLARKACWFLLGFLLIFAAPSAHADLARQHQAYEYLLIPGGRSALLGGAYTALSNDPAGLLYNPGGSVFSEHNEVSLNSWAGFRGTVNYEGAILGQDFQEKTQARSGGFAGGLFQHKPFTLGYLIASIDKRNINQNDYFTGISTAAGEINNFTRIHQESTSFDIIGSSLGFAIGRSFGIGMLVYVYDRSIESMDYQQAEYNDERVFVQETKVKASNQGIAGILGMRFKGSTMSLGLAVKKGQPVLNKSSLGTLSVLSSAVGNPPIITSSVTDQYEDEDELLPLSTRLGFAWHPNLYFLMSFDIRYSSRLASGNHTPDRMPTTNYALGIETGVKMFKLLGGVFTNNSLFPPVVAQRTRQQPHLDYLGRSLGLSFNTTSFDLTFGYIKQMGEGLSQITTLQTTEKVTAVNEQFVASWNFKLK